MRSSSIERVPHTASPQWEVSHTSRSHSMHFIAVERPAESASSCSSSTTSRVCSFRARGMRMRISSLRSEVGSPTAAASMSWKFRNVGAAGTRA